MAGLSITRPIRTVENIKSIIADAGAEVMSAYEGEDDVNRFSDADKAKLDELTNDLVYGIRWDSVNDIMIKGYVIGGVFVETDYTVYPIQETMQRGLYDGESFRPLDPDDSTKFPDGTTATIDGSDGQVMVQIPRFNVLHTIDGNYKYCLMSWSPFNFNSQASYVPPIFGDDQYRYVGAFNGVSATDAVDSEVISAVKDTSGYITNAYPNPFANRTRAQFRAQQQTGFFQYCWGLYEIIFSLYLTEYANWNTQEEIPGYTGASAWDHAYTRPAGRTTGLGNASGSILSDLAGVDSDLSGIVAADEYVANSYRGIENFFGSVWEFIDGINIDNTSGDCHVYVCHNPDNFADDTVTNYIDTGHAPGFGDLDGYIQNMAWIGQHCAFYPSDITGASSSTFICDYHYNSAGGWRVLLCGGSLSYGARAGFGGLTAHYASSSAGSLISVRSAA